MRRRRIFSPEPRRDRALAVTEGRITAPVRTPPEGGIESVTCRLGVLIFQTLGYAMLSALVHVGCDTLRTVSVYIAAIVSSFTDIPGTLCDAWAAIIVTITIFLMLVPLIIEIIRSIIRITKICELKELKELKELEEKKKEHADKDTNNTTDSM